MHSEKPPVSSPLVISAKRTAEFTSVADLKGKKVAINATGAATEYWLSEALRKGGLTIDDVEVVTVPFKDVPASLDSNAIDAAILGEPLATINIDNGLVSILSNDFIDGFDATYLYMSESMLADQATAQGFMRAYLKACADMQGDYMTPEIAAIVEKYTKVPAAVVEKAALPQYDATGAIPVDDLAALQAYFRSRKLLEYDADLDIATIVNVDLAASVAGK
jgi:NitT/TauT family transport system substrate-binding protein